jgi:hypothetical protein
MFFSLVPGLRAARKIGIAERAEARGDTQRAFEACSEALEVLGGKSVNLDMPWCRSAASVALWGYARAAEKLGRINDLQVTLTRWRPVYLTWMKSPFAADEGRYLKWFEDLLGHSQARP